MKTLSMLLLIISLPIHIFCQIEIQNRDFEAWEDMGAFMEPFHWSSLKTADNLATTAPVVLFQDNTGRNGSLCARLEVKPTPFGFDANGIMTTGRIHAELDPENGSAYTDPNNDDFHLDVYYRPDSITGYFKYSPTGNDKGKVEAVFHTGQDSLPSVDESGFIGRARYDITTAQSGWTRFSAPFTYYNMTTQPEFLLIVATAGDSTVAQAGSTVWFDDFLLIYENMSTLEFEPEDLKLTFNPSEITGKLNTKETLPIDVYLFDASGKRLDQHSQKGHSFKMPLKNMENGIYLIKVQAGNAVFTRKFYHQK